MLVVFALFPFLLKAIKLLSYAKNCDNVIPKVLQISLKALIVESLFLLNIFESVELETPKFLVIHI